MADTGSRSRPLKNLSPNADPRNIIAFLKQLHQKGASLTNQDPIYLPTLRTYQPKYLEYSDNLEQNFEQHRQFLLPADLIQLLAETITYLYQNHLEILRQTNLTQLASLTQLADQLYKKDFIDFNQEQRLKNSLDLDELSDWTEIILKGYARVLATNTKKEEAEAELTITKKADTAKVAPPLKTGHQPDRQKSEATQAPSIIPREIDQAVSSYSVLALNATLAAYTADIQDNIPGINFNQLDPNLRQALLSYIRPKVETIILGLSPEQIQDLLSGKGASTAIRLKILRTSHQFLVKNPGTKVLVQTAIDNYFYLNRDKQLNSSNVQLPDHDQALIKIEDEAETESLTQTEPIKISSKLKDLSNHQNLLTDHLSQVLAGFNLDPKDITFAALNINRTLSALVADDPFINPSYIDHLNYFNFALFFGQNVSEKLFKQRQGQLKILLKQVLKLKQARFFHNHPELQTPLVADDQINRQKPQLDQSAIEQKAKRVTTIRTVIKDSSLAGDEATEVLTQTTDILNQDLNRQSWEHLSKKEKTQYVSAVYKEDLKALRLDKELWEQRKKKIIQEFNYLQYLQTKVAIIEQQAKRQLVQDLEQAAAAGQAAAIQQQNLLLAELMASNSFLVPGQQISRGGQNFSYQPALSNQGFDHHLQTRISHSSELLENLAARGLTEAIDKAALGASGGALAAIPGPIRKKLISLFSQQALDKAKKTLPLVFGALTTLAAILLSLLKKLGVMAATALGAAGGLLAAGPIGALVGGAAAGGAAYLAQGSTASTPLLNKLSKPAQEGVKQAASETAKTTRQFGRMISEKATAPAEAGSLSDVTTSALKGTTESSFFSSIFAEAASTSITGAIAMTTAGTALTLAMLQAAFTANVPYTPVISTLTSDKKVSPYVEVIKKATFEPGSCVEDICNPLDHGDQIPVTYEITIKPKDDYALIVKSLVDEISISFNQEKFEELYGTDAENKLAEVEAVVNSAKNRRTIADFPLAEGDKIEPGEEINFSYTKLITPDYNHSSIRNKLEFVFEYRKEGESGESDAITGEVICVGECPQGLGCWPTTGQVTQIPFSNSYSHSALDAFDIGASIGTPVFAPFSGTICKQSFDHEGFGEHLILDSTIEGESFKFRFAHIKEYSGVVKTAGDCVSVSEGQVIGQVGNNGFSTGPHLHYELVNTNDVPHQLSDLVPDGYNVNEDHYPVTSCFTQVQ